MKVPVSMSNRHLHLSQQDAEVLFGQGYELTVKKELSQPEQFACKEVITIKGPKGEINKVRVLWPYRPQTQVEILMGDNYKLGTKAPVRMSGDLAESEAITLIGPEGTVELNEGLIVAQRHIHMTLEDAANYELNNGDTVSVKVEWPRGVTFHNVAVRANEKSALDMHIDSEEGNAAGMTACGIECEIIKN